MKRSGEEESTIRTRRIASAFALALAILCSKAIPNHALAAQVQSYLLFELSASSSASAAAEKLRGTSLANCLQLVIGSHGREVFVHLACDERGDRVDITYLNQAVIEPSRVDGVARTTILSLKHGSD
jgi:hypothetical protein